MMDDNDGNVFNTYSEQIHQPQFEMYANEHCHARRWVDSTVSFAVLSSTLVVGCVPQRTIELRTDD